MPEQLAAVGAFELTVAGVPLEGQQGKSGVNPARFPPLCTGDSCCFHFLWSLVFNKIGKACEAA